MTPLFVYRRVRVLPGKHGPGDFRVEFNGAAPTHGEMVAMLSWIFRAEDRYIHGLGRRMLWLLIKEGVYQNGMPLEQAIENADGPYDWEKEGVFA